MQDTKKSIFMLGAFCWSDSQLFLRKSELCKN